MLSFSALLQLFATSTAGVGGGATKDAKMAGTAEHHRAAFTVVVMTSLLTYRDAAEVCVVRDPRVVDAKQCHHFPPFFAMWFGLTATIKAVDHQVRDFVGNGVSNAFVEMLGEQSSIVPNTAFFALAGVVAPGGAANIKADFDFRQT